MVDIYFTPEEAWNYLMIYNAQWLNFSKFKLQKLTAVRPQKQRNVIVLYLFLTFFKTSIYLIEKITNFANTFILSGINP